MRRHPMRSVQCLTGWAALTVGLLGAGSALPTPAFADATPASAAPTATAGQPDPDRSKVKTDPPVPEPTPSQEPGPTEPPPDPEPTTPPGPDPTTPPPGSDPSTPPPAPNPTSRSPQPSTSPPAGSGAPSRSGTHADRKGGSEAGPPSAPSLPVTGGNLAPVVGLGATTLAAGIGLVFAGRRRSESATSRTSRSEPGEGSGQ